MFTLSHMYVVHVQVLRRTCTAYTYAVHVRRTCMGVTSYCSGHALFFVSVMADRLAMLAAVSIIIIRRRRRRREARVVARLVKGEAIGEGYGGICRDN